ncbi:MAG: ABC transporter ATP-binding protein [Acidobacteria bacterium]|nr:ABC transporter ATP-binding protein [Acidobacteriota bacterium]
MKSLTVQDIGKRYLLTSATRSKRTKATLDLKIAKVPLPWGMKVAPRELWALRNVSFEVEPGTILGVIGPNGAGKSTLLKILARVVRPTEGRVVGHGRVVSLIELGAGFNVDLSARENIFMNAAMHGIPRQEVVDKFDEILDFAEIHDFVDSPLKHYSSGMYLRLAFSVAINMSPHILLADEILAVGDMAFQERCLQRVAEEGKRGLTVLFVSHDMSAITRICQQAMWLKSGKLMQFGDSQSVVAAYTRDAMESLAGGPDTDAAQNARLLEIVSVRLVSPDDGRAIGAVPVDQDLLVRIRLQIRRPMRVRCLVDLRVKNTYVFRSPQPEFHAYEERGYYDVVARVPANLLAETSYNLDVVVYVEKSSGRTYLVNAIDVLSFTAYGAPYESEYRKGVVMPRVEWSVQAVEPESAEPGPSAAAGERAEEDPAADSVPTIEAPARAER